jgi:methylated-DNA-protein-cysteine methyltransferase-like protein
MAETKPIGEFSKQVIAMIQKVPKGKVATYKQIAALAGKPHAVRAIAWILHSSSKAHKLPWQRILNAQGKISFPASSPLHKKQKSLLQKEGIRFSDNGRIDLAKYQWQKKPKALATTRKKLGRSRPQMFQN